MFIVWGKVRHGESRGESLGYPTANISLYKRIPQGIYISQVSFEGKKFESVSFIGNATTFGEKKIQLEAHILSFDGNLYNKWITVRLIKKIRENKKFDSAQQLTAQMKKDVKAAKEYFKNV